MDISIIIIPLIIAAIGIVAVGVSRWYFKKRSKRELIYRCKSCGEKIDEYQYEKFNGVCSKCA